jgi:hypothetical protein
LNKTLKKTNKKPVVAMQVIGCMKKSLVAKEVYGCFGKSQVAMESQWLLWKVTGC